MTVTRQLYTLYKNALSRELPCESKSVSLGDFEAGQKGGNSETQGRVRGEDFGKELNRQGIGKSKEFKTSSRDFAKREGQKVLVIQSIK